MNEKSWFKNLISHPLVICFFGICFGVFLGYLIKEDTQFSDMENRFLAGRPAVNISSLADGSFMQNFEVYCNEQVPARSALVKAKAGFIQLLLGCENDGISKGSDGYLFDKVTNPGSQPDKNIAAIFNFSKMMSDSGREVYIAVAPTSVWINEDKLPVGMPVLDEKEYAGRLDEAVRNLGDAGETIHTVDLYSALAGHSSEELFYRTDHHWTTLGAGYAYKEIAGSMGLDVKDITRYEKHEACDFYGTSYAKFKGFGINPDTIEYYDVPISKLRLEKTTEDTLYDTDKLDTYDKYAMFMFGNDGMYEIIADTGEDDVNSGEDGVNSGDKQDKLIVLKDSYANCLLPYLTMNFNDIIVVDLRYFGGSVGEIIAGNPDAKILLMYNWSFVSEDNHFYKLVK